MTKEGSLIFVIYKIVSAIKRRISNNVSMIKFLLLYGLGKNIEVLYWFEVSGILVEKGLLIYYVPTMFTQHERILEYILDSINVNATL